MDKNQFIAEAEKLYKSGDFTKLEAFSLQHKDSEGISFTAYFFAGLAQSKIKKYHEAIESFNSSLEIEPDNPNVISERGVTYHLLGKNKLAMLDLDKALELEPNNPYRYSSRAFLREVLNDLEGAVEDYQIAIKLDPDDAIAHNNLGLLMEKMGHVQKSQLLLKTADKILGIDIKTENPNTLPQVEENKTQTQEKSEEYFRKTDVIKKVFSDKKMRSEFFQYLKNIFVKKKT